MQFTQTALLLLLLCWSLQVAGSWVQWKHYRETFSQATRRWGDGFVGMGRAQPRLGFGVLALLEVSPGLEVRRLQVMSGFTVFARFKPMAEAERLTLAELSRRFAPGTDESRLARAVRQAIAQIEEVRTRRA